jgi:hypothetical protein
LVFILFLVWPALPVSMDFPFCATTSVFPIVQITLIRHEPSYKQLEVKMNQPSFVFGNHNTEPKT